MRLSEAMRLGAMLRPQATGRLFYAGRSCAIGAVIEAAGVAAYNEELLAQDVHLDKTFPLLAKRCKLPALPYVWDVIVRLNNPPNNWSRERIAAWLETLEDQFESKQSAEELGAVEVCA